MAVRVEVLGPLRLLVDGRPVDVRGQKRRAALALLALAEGRTVPVDYLVDALWPGSAPESGRQALQSHVFRLRRHLGEAAEVLQTRQDGYRLELGPDGLDALRARDLLATARAAKDPARAYAALREAHALWQGPALADLTEIGPVAAAVQANQQLHRDVTDALVDGALAAGAAEQVAALAATSVSDDPLREPAVLLLMRVLAATGHPSEALRVGREYRQRLADEVGLDPSAALDELVRDIASGKAPARRVAAAPAAATRLYGRETEIATLHRLLTEQRLVTVVGPGGVGKTRLALAVAGRYPAATVVRLAPATEPAAIPYALATALGLTAVQGDVLSSCVAVLGDGPGVLVIDNCEHLLDAAREIIDTILGACPDLSVLATSREPVGMAAEYVYRLAPLPLPISSQDPRQVASVAVFLDRAGRVRPGAAAARADLRLVADIVRRLDGIPLAIELAAGRLSTLSIADLQQRLDRALDLLGGRPSGEARHRTMRATVEWSYRLLTDDEQRLFRHLAVFVDGVELAVAERLATDLGLRSDPGGILARLVDASMIEAEFSQAGTRYRMLETLRVFGLDRLTAAGEEGVAVAHLVGWAVELTAWIETSLETEREPEADSVVRRELPNLRAAWRLARDRGALDECASIVAALFDAVAYRDLVELRDWAEELARDPALAGHPGESRVLATAAEAAYHRGDYPRAEQLARSSLELCTDVAVHYGLVVLANGSLARGAFAETAEHALAAAAAAPHREGHSLAALAKAYSGEINEARILNERGLDWAGSPAMRAWASYVAGEIENAAGDLDAAEGHYLRALDLARTAGTTFLAGISIVGLNSVRARAGRFADALAGFREAIDYFALTGNWIHLWTTLRNLADLLHRLGDGEPAAVLDAAADQAPDAPADAGRRAAAPRTVPSRTAILDLARQAIERNATTLRRAGAGTVTADRRTSPR